MLDADPLLPAVLWIGSRPPLGLDVSQAGFDTLVLCERGFQPQASEIPRVELLRCPFQDRSFSVQPPGTLTRVMRAAESVAARCRQGLRCLVVCHQGRNRSGLVCGLTMVELGMDPGVATQLVRDTRLGGLSNMEFRDVMSRVRLG